MSEQTDKVEMILHEKAKVFPHNTITPAERWEYVGKYGTTYHEGGRTEPFIIVGAVKCNGILFLQTAPIDRGIPALN